jgi:hypothetical protein
VSCTYVYVTTVYIAMSYNRSIAFSKASSPVQSTASSFSCQYIEYQKAKKLMYIFYPIVCPVTV